MASFVERVVGAARLDARVYEEVEADPTAMGQAMAVVAAAALASGVGSIGSGAMTARWRRWWPASSAGSCGPS